MRNVIDKIVLRVIVVSAFIEGLVVGLTKGLVWGLAYKYGWMSAKQINQAAGRQLIKED